MCVLLVCIVCLYRSIRVRIFLVCVRFQITVLRQLCPNPTKDAAPGRRWWLRTQTLRLPFSFS